MGARYQENHDKKKCISIYKLTNKGRTHQKKKKKKKLNKKDKQKASLLVFYVCESLSPW